MGVEMMECVIDASEGIKRGYDYRKSVCWECEKPRSDYLRVVQLNECSRCHTAYCCSFEGQRSTWKQGHKQKCPVLATQMSRLEEMLDTVDNTHNSCCGEICYGKHD